MATFLQIAQNLADRVDGTRPSTIYNANLDNLDQTTRRWRNFINKAYKRVWLTMHRDNEYRETETTATTVANTEYIAIPAGITNIDQVKFANEPPIDLMAWPRFERFKEDIYYETVNGSPTAASIYQRRLYFYPVPDAAYTVYIRGQETFTALDADTDTPDIADEFHDVIEEIAVLYEMAYEGDIAGQQLKMETEQWLKLVKNNSRSHASQPPKTMSRREAAYANAVRKLVRNGS
jgi:hypothetical protein